MSLIQKVRYDKRTTNFTPEEERYWMHFLQGDRLIGDYIKSQIRLNPTLRREILNQPVCTRCEKFCFFDKDGTAICPTCGTKGSANKTNTVKIHLTGGHYR